MNAQYRITTEAPVHVEDDDAGARVAFDYAAGQTVTPGSAAEDRALQRLVGLGWAEVIEPRARPAKERA